MWPAGLCLAWFLCLLWPGRGPCAHCSVLSTVCVQGSSRPRHAQAGLPAWGPSVLFLPLKPQLPSHPPAPRTAILPSLPGWATVQH